MELIVFCAGETQISIQYTLSFKKIKTRRIQDGEHM